MPAKQLNNQRPSHSTPRMSVIQSVPEGSGRLPRPRMPVRCEGRGGPLNPVPHRTHTSNVPLPFRARPQRTDVNTLLLPSLAFALRRLPLPASHPFSIFVSHVSLKRWERHMHKNQKPRNGLCQSTGCGGLTAFTSLAFSKIRSPPSMNLPPTSF